MTPNPRRPWKMVLPLAAIIALAALWSLYWFVALATARNELARERSRLERSGLSLACDAESWGGFPFRFEYTCLEPQAAGSMGAEAAAASLRAVAMAYKPWHVLVFLHGPTVVSNSTLRPLTASHDPARASLHVEGQHAGQITIEVANLEANHMLTAGAVLFSARTADSRQFDYAIEVQKLALMLPGIAPISTDRFVSQGSVTQDETLVINSAELLRGNLSLTASGRATLDELRRPRGQVVLKTNDGPALMQVLGDVFQFTEQQNTAFAALLAVAGNQVTLTANNGELYAGPLKIGDLVPLP